MAWCGVLNGQQAHCASDRAAGFDLVEIEIGWDGWQPTQGSFSTSYRNSIVAKVTAYKAAGYTVIISAGLFSPPPWVLALGQYKDQFGALSGSPNWGKASVRAAAQTYLNNLIPALVGKVDGYRIGLSKSGEMWYPSTNSNQWWAYDTDAQATCPMPGWIPGTSTYNGSNVTRAQAESWYVWYLGRLQASHAWEVAAHRTAGWAGIVTYNVGGVGLTPYIYSAALDALLAPSVWWDNVINLGVLWGTVIPALTPTNAIINCTSLYDGSGVPANNASQAGDNALTIAQADPTITHWSAARWIAYLATKAGFGVAIGESVGNSPNEMASEVNPTMAQAHACGYSGVLWANDIAMHDGVHATPTQVAAGFHAAFG